MKEIKNKVMSNGNIPYREDAKDYDKRIVTNGNMHPDHEMNDIKKIQRISEKFDDRLDGKEN